MSVKRLMCPVVYFVCEVQVKMHAEDYASNIHVVASIMLDVIRDVLHTKQRNYFCILILKKT